MTLPLLDELRRCFPQATISVATQPEWAPIFAHAPSVDQVLPLERSPPGSPSQGNWNIYSLLKFYRAVLRGQRFDVAINPRWDVDLYLATMLCNLTLAPLTIGYEDRTSLLKLAENKGFERGYNVLLRADAPLHEVQRNLNVLTGLGEKPLDVSPRIRLDEEQRAWALDWIGDSRDEFVLVLGLPATAAKRRWDAAHYIDLIRALPEDRGLLVIVIADRATLPAAKAIQEEFPDTRIAFGLSLLDTMAIIQSCDFYVGSDSGLAHVSAALDRETIVISPHPVGGDREHFNSPERFRPYGSNATVIQPVALPGCELNCSRSEPHCILNISAAEVAAMIRSRNQSSTVDPEIPQHHP